MRIVGIDFIDDEHALLLGMATELNAAFLSRHEHSAIVSMLSKIDRFIRDHFAEEECLLAKLDKTGLELKRHRTAHTSLLARAEQLIGDPNRSNQQVSGELAALIEYWLHDHIVNYDNKIRELFDLEERHVESTRQSFQDGAQPVSRPVQTLHS